MTCTKSRNITTVHPDLNKLSIIPRGPDFERILKAPHDRGVLDTKRRRIEDDSSKVQVSISDGDEKTSLHSDDSVETL